MANATISGNPPSVFYPAPSTVTATDLATPEAPMTDAERLNDPEFQADYNAYLERLEREWRNDPEAQAEFDAWVTEQERIALETEGEMTPEEEADLCNRYDADADVYAELRCGAGHYLAGHDNVWQAGGSL